MATGRIFCEGILHHAYLYFLMCARIFDFDLYTSPMLE